MNITSLNDLNVLDTHMYQMVDNYLYLYHVDTFIVLPLYADNISDTTSVSFAQNTPLGRSAPIYSYQNSGPRTLSLQFNLHRDLMTQINYGVSTAPVKLNIPDGDDYVDLMVKYVQAAALPSYSDAIKMVNPPIVALRMGDIYIKGVISGAVSIGYQLPVLTTGKYATITIGFTISEVNPYDAETVMQIGSYRIADNLDRGVATSDFLSTLNSNNAISV